MSNQSNVCEECNGFGMVHDRWTATNEVCPDCNGTGRKSELTKEEVAALVVPSDTKPYYKQNLEGKSEPVSENIKENPDGTLSPIDPSKPSRFITKGFGVDPTPDLDQILTTMKLHNKDLDACFNDAVAVHAFKQAIESLITEAYKKGYIDGSFNNLDGLKGER